MKLNGRMYDAVLRVVFVLAYAFPYTFFVLYGYCERGRIRYFFLMAATMAFLALASWWTKHRLVAGGSLIFTTASSLVFTADHAADWSKITAPLNVFVVFALVIFGAILIHAAMWLWLDKKYGKRE